MTVMQGMWIYYIRLKNEKEFKFQLGKDSVIGEGEWELRIKIMTIAKLYTSNLENMETFEMLKRNYQHVEMLIFKNRPKIHNSNTKKS